MPQQGGCWISMAHVLILEPSSIVLLFLLFMGLLEELVNKVETCFCLKIIS